MRAGEIKQLETKIDCFGVKIPRSEVEKTHKSLYWGGGISGDPEGPESDFTKSMVRFTKAGARVPESIAAYFTGEVPKDDRNAETFKAFLYWHRGQYPHEYEQPSAVASSAHLAQRCAVIGNSFETGGRYDTEPLWFGVLKCVAAAEPDISIEVSDQHPKFSLAELGDRMERIESERLKPATCAYLSDHSDLCSQCEWFGKIRSPMKLAFDRLPRVTS